MISHRAVVNVVSEAWCSVLGVGNDQADGNFFALGGDSLAAIELAKRVELSLPITFPIESLFLDGSLSSLVDECAARCQAQRV